MNDTLVESTLHDRPSWARGVLASYDSVSQGRRASDVEHLEQRVSALERMITTHALQLATPTEVGNLRVPLPMVATIVAGFLMLGAGMYAFRSDVLTRLDNNERDRVNTARTNDMQYQTMKERMDSFERQMRLQYAEFQTFRTEMAGSRRR